MTDAPPSPVEGEIPYHPSVRLPRKGLPGFVLIAGAALLALALFVALDSRRLRREAIRPEQSSAGGDAFPWPPELVLPPPPTPPIERSAAEDTPPDIAVPSPQLPPDIMPSDIPRGWPIQMPTSVPTAPVPPRAEAPRPVSVSNEPALVFDGGAPAAATAGATTPAASTATASATAPTDVAITATVIRNQAMVVPMGTLIPAVLETPLDSTRPGLVRAIVSEDAKGFDGKRVLIPRGSRLIGEYASDIQSGQSRVLVNWLRLIRPDGVAIRISSPAADALGGAGIPGRVNTFFLQRFANALLQSALQVGVNLASRPGNGSVIVSVPTSSVANVGQSLLPSIDTKPRIRVRQGAMMDVFVAHDLDFSGTPAIERE